MMKTAKELLSSNVSRLRAKRGWTLPELAEAADLSVQMVQKIEYRKTNPSSETLDKLSKALGVPVAVLYSPDGTMPFQSQSTQDFPSYASASAFLQAFEALTPHRKKFVLALVFRNREILAEEPKLYQALQTLFPVRQK